MEAKKRAAAIAALCMLLLLTLPKPSHQQLSEVKCECYRKCYPGCKNSTPPWLCKVMCAYSCPFFDDTFDPLRTCLNACNTDSICDLPVPLADPEACVDECYNVWGAPGPDPDKEH